MFTGNNPAYLFVGHEILADMVVNPLKQKSKRKAKHYENMEFESNRIRISVDGLQFNQFGIRSRELWLHYRMVKWLVSDRR
jgi:hypothetical protein